MTVIGLPDGEADRLARLADRIRPRRTTAEVRISHRGQLIAGGGEQRFDDPADLLRVLQGTWRVEGHKLPGLSLIHTYRARPLSNSEASRAHAAQSIAPARSCSVT